MTELQFEIEGDPAEDISAWVKSIKWKNVANGVGTGEMVLDSLDAPDVDDLRDAWIRCFDDEFTYWRGRVQEVVDNGEDIILSLADPSVELEDTFAIGREVDTGSMSGAAVINRLDFAAGFVPAASWVGRFVFFNAQLNEEKKYIEEGTTGAGLESYRATARDDTGPFTVPFLPGFIGAQQFEGAGTAFGNVETNAVTDTATKDGIYHQYDGSVARRYAVEYTMTRNAITGNITEIGITGYIEAATFFLMGTITLYLFIYDDDAGDYVYLTHRTGAPGLGGSGAILDLATPIRFLAPDVDRFISAGNEFKLLVGIHSSISLAQLTFLKVDHLRVHVTTTLNKNDPFSAVISRQAANTLYVASAPILQTWGYDGSDQLVVGDRISSFINIPSDYTLGGIAGNFIGKTRRQVVDSAARAAGMKWYWDGREIVARNPLISQDEIRVLYPQGAVGVVPVEHRRLTIDVETPPDDGWSLGDGSNFGGCLFGRGDDGYATMTINVSDIFLREVIFSVAAFHVSTVGDADIFEAQIGPDVLIEIKWDDTAGQYYCYINTVLTTIPDVYTNPIKFKVKQSGDDVLIYTHDSTQTTWELQSTEAACSIREIDEMTFTILENLHSTTIQMYHLSWEYDKEKIGRPILISPLPRFRTVSSTLRQVSVYSKNLGVEITIPDPINPDPSMNEYGDPLSPRSGYIVDNELWSAAALREKIRIMLEAATDPAETAIVEPFFIERPDYPFFVGQYVFLPGQAWEIDMSMDIESGSPLVDDFSSYADGGDVYAGALWANTGGDSEFTGDGATPATRRGMFLIEAATPASPIIESFEEDSVGNPIANGTNLIGKTVPLGSITQFGNGTAVKVVSGVEHYAHITDTAGGSSGGMIITFASGHATGAGVTIEFYVYPVNDQFGYFVVRDTVPNGNILMYRHTTGDVFAFASGGTKITTTSFPSGEWVKVKVEIISDTKFKAWVNDVPCMYSGSAELDVTTSFSGRNIAGMSFIGDTLGTQQYYVKELQTSWITSGGSSGTADVAYVDIPDAGDDMTWMSAVVEPSGDSAEDRLFVFGTATLLALGQAWCGGTLSDTIFALFHSGGTSNLPCASGANEIRLVRVTDTTFDVRIDGVLHDNGGAHYTVAAGDFTAADKLIAIGCLNNITDDDFIIYIDDVKADHVISMAADVLPVTLAIDDVLSLVFSSIVLIPGAEVRIEGTGEVELVGLAGGVESFTTTVTLPISITLVDDELIMINEEYIVASEDGIDELFMTAVAETEVTEVTSNLERSDERDDPWFVRRVDAAWDSMKRRLEYKLDLGTHETEGIEKLQRKITRQGDDITTLKT